MSNNALDRVTEWLLSHPVTQLTHDVSTLVSELHAATEIVTGKMAIIINKDRQLHEVLAKNSDLIMEVENLRHEIASLRREVDRLSSGQQLIEK